MPECIRIELAVALPDHQELIELEVPAGATIADVLERCDLSERVPELEVDPDRVGVFGRLRPMDHRLADGDRIEIYRPLKADPKEVRRQLAALKGTGQKS